jgi:beta-barrel assembly-enhancing protease
MDYNPFTAFRTMQLSDYSSYEGEISVLDQFLTNLPDEAKVALGLRFIHDIYVKDTTDVLIGRMWQKAIEMAAVHSDFDPDRFSKSTFREAIVKLEEARLAAEADTTATSTQRWDKYETIKNQRAGLTVDSGIDSSKFYLYGISDLLNDSLFNKQFNAYREKQKEKERREEDEFALTDEEIYDINQVEYEDRLHLGLDTVLFVNPLVTEYRGFDRIDFPKSDKLEQTLIESVRTISSDLGVTVNYLDRTQLQTMTTQQYNDMSLVLRTIAKGIETTEPDVFMIDLERLDSLKLVYGSSKVMMMTLDHAYNNHITPGLAVAYTVLLPLGVIYFPIALLTAHTTQMSFYVIDLEKGTLLVNEEFYSQDPASRKMIEARLHSVFNQFNQPATDDPYD